MRIRRSGSPERAYIVLIVPRIPTPYQNDISRLVIAAGLVLLAATCHAARPSDDLV